MKHALLTAGAIAALMTATSAYAQYTTTPPAAPTAPATMPPGDQPAMPAPAPGATMPGAASPEATMPATPSPEAAAPAPASPEAAGQTMSPAAAQTPADWAKFDKGGKGYLDALEFGNWMMAKQGQDMSTQVNKSKSSKAANLPAVKVLNATGSAFLKADANGDRRITPDELAGAVAG